LLANAYTTEQLASSSLVDGNQSSSSESLAKNLAIAENIGSTYVNNDVSNEAKIANTLILDTPDQWLSFSQSPPTQQYGNQHSDTSLVESTLLLDGIHCAACSGIIERGLGMVPGIVNARVSMSKNRAIVVWSPSVTLPSKIIAAVHALGYGASPATELSDTIAAIAKQRAAFWRWMVAGFCMMQVMMYAGPSYFAKAGDISTDMQQLLNWAGWLLSLPVLLFSSKPFFSSALHDIKSARISMDLPVAIGIAITFIVSSAATFSPNSWWGHTVYFDSLTMFVFFLLSARLIEAKLHSKTLGALESLINRIPESAERQNADGTYSRVLNRQLKLNDIVRIHLGEAFPADGKLIGDTTFVDESLLTGESTPIAKNLNDHVIAGSFNLGQTVTVAIEKLGAATQYGQIVNLINQASIDKPRLSKIADSIAKPFLIFVMLSAGLVAVLLWDVDRSRALMTAAAVLIVTCPCALSLATPAAMLASASAFVKRGILIRNLQAIESIAAIDTVIFDKTGTLTDGDIKIQKTEYSTSMTEQTALVLAASLAQHSMHPISRAIVLIVQEANLNASLTQTTETTEIAGGGISGTLLNTTLNTLETKTIKLGSAQFCGIKITDSHLQQVYLADNQGWLATFTLQESLKPNAASTVQSLKEAGFTVELLSGDQSHTVEEVAQIVGISNYKSAYSPQAKLSYLQQLKLAGKKVLMVGDGLNDGPIVASAHASIAMGKGVPLTVAQADYILLNGDISQIPALILHAKKTMRVIKQNLAWAIIYNLVCIPLAFFGVLSAWLAGLGMAISSLIVILNALRQTHFSNVAIEKKP